MLLVPEIRKFDELLNKNLQGNWKYVEHNSEYLIPAGENYGSIMLAINVKIEENGIVRELKLVGKLCPPTEILKEAFLTTITFVKEAKSYQNCHPLLKEFEKEYNIPPSKCLDIFPKCYGARINLTNGDIVDNDAVILLENLKVQGYVLVDRFKGIDFNSTQLIIKNLARLHATYIAIRLKKPQEFNKFLLPVLNNINNGGVMVNGFIDTSLHYIKFIKECEKYREPFTKMLESRKLLNGLRFPIESDTKFYSIVHNDLWTNNIMLAKDATSLSVKLRIIDLQLLNYGSPIRDLIFFLYTSVEMITCDKYFDFFLHFYYVHFVDCLRNYECSLEYYSWEAFLKEINLVAPHELFHIIFMLKPIFSERADATKLGDLKMEDFGRLDNVGEVYINKLRQVVLSFAKKNWI